MGTQISVVMGIHNRANLLEYGLHSLANQTLDKNDFEVIVVDQGSTDHVRGVVQAAQLKSLNVKYIRIDPSKFNGELYKGKYINPALQQNVGIRYAQSDIVVLTSPEIVHADTNLERLLGMRKLSTPVSIYGKVFESPIEWVSQLQGDYSFETLSHLPQGITLLPNLEGENRISAYFIGAFYKTLLYEIGGLDERYMAGIAFEDDDFGLRMAAVASPVVSDKLLGVHLPHDRSYQRDYGWDKNKEYFNSKGFDKVPKFIEHFAAPLDTERIVANQGHTWGDLDLIIETL